MIWFRSPPECDLWHLVQVMYAALDAYCSVSIFDAMAAFVETRPLSAEQAALVGNRTFYGKYVHKIIHIKPMDGNALTSSKERKKHGRGGGRGRGRGRAMAGKQN